MSKLLKLLSTLRIRRDVDVLGHQSRRFSSSLSQNQPYLILGGDLEGTNLKGEYVGYLKYYDPCKGGDITVSEENVVPMGLLGLMGRFGSSHGWVASLDIRDGTMSLHDDLNPTTTTGMPKRISLPPLVTMPYCQTQLVTNVAMSSSPEQEDCVVAVKFWGPQLSLCRPGGSKWFNITTPPSFFASHVMYSKRDQMFCMPSSGGFCMGSWDLRKHRYNPKVKQLRFCGLPKLMQSEWELLDSCFRREELVEYSPTSESFLVKWYSVSNNNLAKVQTKRFMVFKIDEEGNASYTEDIGDLCIFLSKSEPFCLSASLYSGLTPNSVYFVGDGDEDVGVCNLATSTIHPTISPLHCPSTAAPFWLQNYG